MALLLGRREPMRSSVTSISPAGHHILFGPFTDPCTLGNCEISKMKHAVHVKHSALMEAKRQLEASQGDVTKLEADAKAVHKQWCELREKIIQLQQEHDDEEAELKLLLKESAEESAKKDQQIIDLQAQLQAAQQHAHSADEGRHAAILEREVAIRSQQAADAAQQVAAASARSAKQECEAALQSRGVALTAQQAAVSSQQQAEAAAAKNQQSLQDLTFDQSRLSTQLSTLQHDLAQSSAQAESEKASLSEQLQQAVANLAEHQSAWSSARAALNIEVTRLTQDVDRLEQANHAATSSQQQLQTDLGTSHSSFLTQQQTLQDEVKQLKEAAQQASDANTNMAAERDALAKALAEACADCEQQGISSAALEEQIEDMKVQAEHAQQACKDAVTEKEQLHNELVKAQNTLERQHDMTKQSLGRQVSSLTEEVKQAKDSCDALSNDTQQAQQELQDAQTALGQAQRAINQHQHEQREAKQEYETQVQQLKRSAQQATKTAASEMSALRAQVAELKSSAEQAVRDTASQKSLLEAQLGDLKTQLVSAAGQLQHQQQSSATELQQLQAQATSLQQQHEQAMQSLKDTMQEAVASAEAEGRQLQQQLGAHVSQQQHEEALRDMEQQWQQAVAQAKADGEAAVQAVKNQDASGFHRNDEVRHREHVMHSHERQRLEDALNKSVAKVEELQQKVKDLSKQVQDADSAHPQLHRPQTRRRQTAHAPQRRSATPKQAQPLTTAHAAEPSLPRHTEAAPQQPPQQADDHMGMVKAEQSMQEAAGPSGQTPLDGNTRQNRDGPEGKQPTTLWGRAVGLLTGRKAAKEPETQLGSSDSEQGREASQAEAAQGFESAQEEFAPPQPPKAAASTKGRSSGQGRGRGRGRGGITSSRPAASKAAPTDDAQGGESSQPEGSAQEGIAGGPVKRGRGRPRSQPMAAAATAAASPMQAPAAALAEANELHGVAPEPAGPVMSDAEQAEPQKKRKRRAAGSVAESKQEATAAARQAAPGVAEAAPARQTRAVTRSRASVAAADMQDTAATSVGRVAGRRRTKAPTTFTLLDPISEDELQQRKPAKKQKRK